jgi:hypothetical protein
MEGNKTLKLVNGVFTPGEAHSVIGALISAKLDFHAMQDFSNTIRLGREKGASEHRIAELKYMREQLKIFVDEAQRKNCNLKISGTIVIDFVEDNAKP